MSWKYVDEIPSNYYLFRVAITARTFLNMPLCQNISFVSTVRLCPYVGETLYRDMLVQEP